MFWEGSLDPLPLTLRSKSLFARGREEDWEEVENCLFWRGEGIGGAEVDVVVDPAVREEEGGGVGIR
jgi:hypothetical protein